MSFFWIGHYIWAIPLKVLHCITKGTFVWVLLCCYSVIGKAEKKKNDRICHPLSSNSTIFIHFVLITVSFCFVLTTVMLSFSLLCSHHCVTCFFCLFLCVLILVTRTTVWSVCMCYNHCLQNCTKY
jgi:hypothetical protein